MKRNLSKHQENNTNYASTPTNHNLQKVLSLKTCLSSFQPDQVWLVLLVWRTLRRFCFTFSARKRKPRLVCTV